MLTWNVTLLPLNIYAFTCDSRSVFDDHPICLPFWRYTWSSPDHLCSRDRQTFSCMSARTSGQRHTIGGSVFEVEVPFYNMLIIYDICRWPLDNTLGKWNPCGRITQTMIIAKKKTILSKHRVVWGESGRFPNISFKLQMLFLQQE